MYSKLGPHISQDLWDFPKPPYTTGMLNFNHAHYVPIPAQLSYPPITTMGPPPSPSPSEWTDSLTITAIISMTLFKYPFYSYSNYSSSPLVLCNPTPHLRQLARLHRSADSLYPARGSQISCIANMYKVTLCFTGYSTEFFTIRVRQDLGDKADISQTAMK